MKQLAIFLILLLLVPAAASAASGSALQPVRTVAVATATTTPAPALTLVRVATVAPAAVTCTAPAACMSEQDAIAKWGSGNFAKNSDLSCGSQASAQGSTVLLYCYLTTLSSGPTEKDKYLENGQFALEKSPAVPATTATTVTVPATPSATVTIPATVKGVQAPATVSTVAVVQPTTTITTAPTPAAAGAKPASIVDSVMNFFASLFGGGKSSGGSNPPSGGDMEPTPTLPGGMKPVTQVTTPKGQATIDNTITVTSPPAGAKYHTGEVIPVTWVKPNNPAGTVSLKLVSRGGSTQTEWAYAVVPNTGSFNWHQQDLAHDCGVGNNPACWGGLTSEDLGSKSPIQYQNAWDLPAYNDVAVEVSTDAMDPYPAFYGSSGTFTIVNGHAFIDTKLETAKYFKAGNYPSQVNYGPAQTTPWVGYRNSQNGPDPALYHEMWRTIIVPDFPSGYYIGDTFKKATLILKVRTDKGAGNGVGAGEYDVKTHSAVAQAWALDGKYEGFKPKSELPVIAGYDLPTTAGSTTKGTYDPAAGTVTIDLTDPVNQWFKKAGSHSVVLVGPDETGQDSLGFFYSRIEEVTFIVEKA